jgi:hypothetical protein
MSAQDASLLKRSDYDHQNLHEESPLACRSGAVIWQPIRTDAFLNPDDTGDGSAVGHVSLTALVHLGTLQSGRTSSFRHRPRQHQTRGPQPRPGARSSGTRYQRRAEVYKMCLRRGDDMREAQMATAARSKRRCSCMYP